MPSVLIIIFIYHTRTEHKIQKLNSVKKVWKATREATAHWTGRLQRVCLKWTIQATPVSILDRKWSNESLLTCASVAVSMKHLSSGTSTRVSTATSQETQRRTEFTITRARSCTVIHTTVVHPSSAFNNQQLPTTDVSGSKYAKNTANDRTKSMNLYWYMKIQSSLWYFKNQNVQTLPKFCTCNTWSWLSPLVALWCVMYFRFCGSRYVCT